jgi:hypothetical protein
LIVNRSLEKASASAAAESATATTAALAASGTESTATLAAASASAVDSLQEDARRLDALHSDTVQRLDHDARLSIHDAQLREPGDDNGASLLVQLKRRLLSVVIGLLLIVEPQWLGFDDDLFGILWKHAGKLLQVPLPVGAQTIAS